MKEGEKNMQKEIFINQIIINRIVEFIELFDENEITLKARVEELLYIGYKVREAENLINDET